MMGWEEVSQARLLPTSVAQQWKNETGAAAVADAPLVILSPASRTYLDMKYDAACELGLEWGGFVDVRDAYDWDPGTFLPGIPEARILGVEAPLWSETLHSYADVEFMTFPRLAALAEVAWTPRERIGWEGFRSRLSAHGRRWAALGMHFYPSPQVAWEE